MARTCSVPSDPVCSLPDPSMRCNRANTRVSLCSALAGIRARTEPSIRPAGCPQGTLAPGAPSPDRQKVKYEFHPSRHFNDFTWEPKERRETERSRTSCLVTKGGRLREWGEGNFYLFFFLRDCFSTFRRHESPLQHLRCYILHGHPPPWLAETPSSGCFYPHPVGRFPLKPTDSVSS